MRRDTSTATAAQQAPSAKKKASPSDSAGTFWTRTSGNWVTFGATILAALIAGGFGLAQWEKNKKLQRQIEAERREWDEKKLRLELDIGLERKRKEADLDVELEAEKDRAAAIREREAEVEEFRTMEQQAAATCRKIAAELSTLKILDMSQPLNLDAVYVKVRVREEVSARYIKEEELDRAARGDVKEWLRTPYSRFRDQTVTSTAPQEALAKFHRIALLGDPGAGKTTMLRYLAFRMAQSAIPSLPGLPIYTELRRFVDSGLGNLLDYVAADWANRYGFQNARPYLEQQLESGKAALLLDGLDEVLGGVSVEASQAAYNRVATEINRLVTRYPDVSVAVTCRRAGWRGGLTAFQTLEVMEFDWEQIQKFVANWFAASPTQAEGLTQVLGTNPRMQMLAANPLMLSLIAIVYARELELPERRAELYNRCAEVLLREWDAHRGIKRFGAFTADRKRDLLKEVAWRFHGEGRRYYDEPTLLGLIAEFLPSIDVPAEENKAILDEVAAHYGLLKEQAPGWYGFLHLTLQEYFAALAASDRGAAGLEEVIANRHDPWWEEVILLLAGRLSDATPLLLGILGYPASAAGAGDVETMVSAGDLPAEDDLFHNDLLLATQCLIGTPRVRMRGLRERITEELKQAFLTSSFELDSQSTASVLVQIGGEGLEREMLSMVASSQGVSDTKKSAILSAFGKFGDRRTGEALVGLLEMNGTLEMSTVIGVADALAALKFDAASPRLVEILRKYSLIAEENPSKRTTLDYTISRIARGLATVGKKAVIPELMKAVRLSVDRRDASGQWSNAGPVLEAIASLDDPDVLPDLLELLVPGRNFFTWGEDLIRAIVKLGGRQNASRFVEVALSDSFEPSMRRSAVIDGLKPIMDLALAATVLELLPQDSIPWQVRWALTESLDQLDGGDALAVSKIMKMPKLDPRVRLGLATTLCAWGDRSQIPYLRSGIDRHAVPPSWQLDNFTQTGAVWGRIVDVLQNQNDDSIAPLLLAALERADPPGPSYDSSSAGDWDGILASMHRIEQVPESITKRLLARAAEAPRDAGSFVNTNPSYDVATFATKGLIPEVLALLEEFEPHDSWAAVRVATRIGELADDTLTLERLLRFVASQTAQDNPYGDSLYRAVYAVSQRARVRVFADGRIEPIHPRFAKTATAPPNPLKLDLRSEPHDAVRQNAERVLPEVQPGRI